jgi:hypothetical protein
MPINLLFSPPVIYRVHVSAVESVPMRSVHGDALCRGSVAVGAHPGVRVSARQVDTCFHIGSAGDSEFVDRVEESIETGIG